MIREPAQAGGRVLKRALGQGMLQGSGFKNHRGGPLFGSRLEGVGPNCGWPALRRLLWFPQGGGMDWTGDDEEWMGRENEEYRSLTLQHHEFQEKLDQLAAKRALTEDEKLKEVRIKKEKLFVKDRMAAIRREHAASKRSAPEPA